MTHTEEYFFDNNITVLNRIPQGTIAYFVTDEGQFLESLCGTLFKEESDGEWEEIKKADAATSASI